MSEDELVELVKFAKSELLARYNKYRLKSTEYNLLKIKGIFDFDRAEQQFKRAIGIAIGQLTLIISCLEDTTMSEARRLALLEEAKMFNKLLKEFLDEKK